MTQNANDWHHQAPYCLRWFSDTGPASLSIVKEIFAQEK